MAKSLDTSYGPLFAVLSTLQTIWILPVNALPSTWIIPSNATSIQSGVDSSSSGDTVLVSPGFYTEYVTIADKSIVISGAGSSSTIWSGAGLQENNGALLNLMDADSTTVVSGFTFSDVNNTFGDGGAISCSQSSPHIYSNVFKNNTASGGGSISVDGEQSNPRIEGNLFQDNRAGSGGAIVIWDFARAWIYGNEFIGNGRVTGSDMGGAISIELFACAEIDSNLMSENRAYLGASVYVGYESTAIISRSTIVSNNSMSASGVSAIAFDYRANGGSIDHCILALNHNGCAIGAIDPSSSILLTCNDLWHNDDGDYSGLPAGSSDLHVDPMFCNPSAHVYSLSQQSPCLAQNNGQCGQIGALPQGCNMVVGVPETFEHEENSYPLRASVVYRGREPELVLESSSRAGKVNIRIVDVEGRLVTKFNEELEPERRLILPLTRQSMISGIYFVLCIAGGYETHARFTFLR